MGSADPQASAEEAPGWTNFDHDYWLDTIEVTQAEFQHLMGRNPSPSVSASPDKPAVNVTWFDAILFCNARSKRQRLDTVYEYSSVSFDSTSSAWAIQGLSCHFDRGGWRLPTEAEWEYAARAGESSAYSWGELSDSGKAVEYAWFQKNSGASLQKGARLKPNAWGFYDMAGNAMEWVQDWMGSFPKDTVKDFVGPDAPPDVPEAPLKGGAYNYGMSHLRPSSRTATYAAYRSAKAEYVGFRCARGGFAPTFLSASGQVVQASPVSLLLPDLARRLGIESARLVFLNRSNGKGVLSWIDFGETFPVVRSLPDKDPAFHPTISPDGRWVAWCTAMEGSTQPGHIKIRRLVRNDTAVYDLGEGAIPRWWTSGTDTFLIRASGMDNTSSSWNATKTLAQRWSGGGLTGPVEEWAGSGSYHDGRSGRYLYTGYRRLRQWNVDGGSGRVLFTAPQNGKSPGDTSQVCNVSVAPDGTGRVLFLDFGYSGASTVVGRPYGIHEVAFMADSLGNIRKAIPVPSGKSQWDHLEWSNDPQWAVGVALEANGAYKEVHLLDFANTGTTAIISGQELWMPTLWVGKASVPVIPGSADLDSSGAWDTPNADGAGMEFAAKVQKFWALRDRINIAFVGSSRIKSGIDPSIMESGKAFNWGYSGGEVLGARMIVEQYVLPQCSRLQVVVLSLMPGWMFSYREWTWRGIRSTVGYQYEKNHKFWKEGVPSTYLDLVAKKYWPVSDFFDSLGGRDHGTSGSWGSLPLEYAPPTVESFSQEPFLSNWRDLVETVSMCEARNIHVILVHFPQSPLYTEMPGVGRYGPSWGAWKALSIRLNALQSDHPFLHYYDAHADGKHDFPESAFINEDHLNHNGAVLLTRRLDSMIRTFALRPLSEE